MDEDVGRGERGIIMLAVIPARGGSKGIPRKNLQRIGGVPLVVRAVRAAKAARRIERVVVSTDDAEIGRFAEDAGAEVVWRPAELSTDHSSSEMALLHVLGALQEREGYRPKWMAFLQCTSPFTVGGDVDGVLALVEEGGYDTAFTAVRSHGFLWRKDSAGGAEGINHDKRNRPRRQEREEEFLETGAVYGMVVEGFLAARHRFFGRTGIYEVPRLRAMEIDEPEDLEMANALCELMARREQIAKLPSRVRALVMDFDGVLTDNRVLVMEDGREAVLCSRADGFGLGLLRESGVELLILSKERNPVVSHRAGKLGIECLQGVDEKLPAMLRWLKEKGIEPGETVFVGNDLNDIECLRAAGCGACVADGHEQARREADLQIPERGGRGAVRWLSQLILERNANERLG